MKNGGQNFLSRQVMMMCHRLQDKIEVEGRREGETQGWIGGMWSDFNIERIKRISSTAAEPQMVIKHQQSG